MISFFSFIFLTQSPWTEIAPAILSIWISLDVSLLVVIYALILTFGIIRFNQGRMSRDYILLILSVNMIVIAFLFLVTHPVNADLLPEIASREKNRTVIVYMGIVGMVCIGALTKFSRKSVTDGINRIVPIIGFILVPSFCIISIFIPNFVLLTYTPDTGITILAYVILIGTLSVISYALVTFLNHWRKRREWFDLSIVIATSFWFSSVVGFGLQTSPYQLMEILWPLLNASGYALLAGAMIIESIIAPHRVLENQVSQIDEALRNSEERLQLALSGADLGVWDWFSISNLYIIDGRFAEILGYEKTEMILTSQDWKNMLHPDDQELALSRWESHVDGKSPIYSSEHRIRRKTGEYVWVLERGKVQEMGKDGVSRRATGTILDTTELVSAQEETRQLGDIATFYLDLMGHDIRNRLQAVLLGIGILQESIEIGNHSDALDLSVQSIEACQRIISGIYATEGLVTAPIFDMNLCEAVHTSVQQLSNLLTGTEVDMRVPETQCMIRANEYVYVMINNLIDNAIRHNNSEQKRLWLEIIILENQYQLVISDNGQGIEDSFKDSIFDTDRRFGGIGVHQARRIAEKYRGVIQMKDRVAGDTSQGTKVVISFPKIS